MNTEGWGEGWMVGRNLAVARLRTGEACLAPYMVGITVGYEVNPPAYLCSSVLIGG